MRMIVRGSSRTMIRRLGRSALMPARGAGCSPAALHAGVRRARGRRARASGPRVSAFAGAVDRAVDRRRGRRRFCGRSAGRWAVSDRCRATRCRSPVCGSCAPAAWSRSMSRRSCWRVCSRPAIPLGLAGIFGYGGWWAVPAAVCVGLVLAAVFHGARWVLDEVAQRRERPARRHDASACERCLASLMCAAAALAAG